MLRLVVDNQKSTNQNALVVLGTLYMGQKNYVGAIEVFRKVLSTSSSL